MVCCSRRRESRSPPSLDLEDVAFTDSNSMVHLNGVASAVKPGSLGLLIYGAKNLPRSANPFVSVDVLAKNGTCLASDHTFPLGRNSGLVWNWNQLLSFPNDPELKNPGTPTTDAPPEDWDLATTEIKFVLWSRNFFFQDTLIGSCTVSLVELLEEEQVRLLVWDKNGEPILGSAPPAMPCDITVSVVRESMPSSWPCHADGEDVYHSYHAFIMTRGTRGDVQPFVALARGMAEELGWMVTICTELRWKSFVRSYSNVSRGKIRFRPSGGDTEARMGGVAARWALESKHEFMQMTLLSAAEVEFFRSATVFVSHVLEMDQDPATSVDLLIFGLTVARTAALISELCDKPLIGFILQPSCIPSKDAEWTAVQAIPGHTLQKHIFTSHSCLRCMKRQMEENRLRTYNLNHLRESFRLPVCDTFDTLKKMNCPLVIPMQPSTFSRPADWWENIVLTDFIFLRGGSSGGKLDEGLANFVDVAHKEEGRLALMTFSSMLVARRQMLSVSATMVEQCRFNLRLVYVGKRQSDHVPQQLDHRIEVLKRENRFIEVDKADFGVLFKEMDCFIVHGGLGTTVEALRLRKPCVVTGPLLLDQRFWGTVCFQKDVGPEPSHLEDFEKSCVTFADGALDPEDPFGWQAQAKQHDWGDESQDGVSLNVQKFKEFMETQLQSVSTSSKSCKKF